MLCSFPNRVRPDENSVLGGIREEVGGWPAIGEVKLTLRSDQLNMTILRRFRRMVFIGGVFELLKLERESAVDVRAIADFERIMLDCTRDPRRAAGGTAVVVTSGS
jgi:hypothetical protein